MKYYLSNFTYPYINNFTGAVYRTRKEAIKDAFRDFKHFPKCRTIKIFSISKIKEA